jgi:toluene monooxygenase system ferredoxin subunit
MTWSSVGSADDLWEGDLRGHVVDGHEVIVLRLAGGGLHAYQGICPHQEQRLADGELDGTRLTCFGHLWVFDATTGAGLNPGGCQLSRYPVEERDGQIHVRTAGVVPSYSY